MTCYFRRKPIEIAGPVITTGRPQQTCAGLVYSWRRGGASPGTFFIVNWIGTLLRYTNVAFVFAGLKDFRRQILSRKGGSSPVGCAPAARV